MRNICAVFIIMMSIAVYASESAVTKRNVFIVNLTGVETIKANPGDLVLIYSDDKPKLSDDLRYVFCKDCAEYLVRTAKGQYLIEVLSSHQEELGIGVRVNGKELGQGIKVRH